jgi:hypothetical protein
MQTFVTNIERIVIFKITPPCVRWHYYRIEMRQTRSLTFGIPYPSMCTYTDKVYQKPESHSRAIRCNNIITIITLGNLRRGSK